MPKYKRKPTETEALEWTGFNEEAMKEFTSWALLDVDSRTFDLILQTPIGQLRAKKAP